jgi:hypothetical protein
MSEGITREQNIELENNIGNLILLASLVTYIGNKITITIPINQ